MPPTDRPAVERRSSLPRSRAPQVNASQPMDGRPVYGTPANGRDVSVRARLPEPPGATGALALTRLPEPLAEARGSSISSLSRLPEPPSNARFTGLPQLADVASGERVLGPGTQGDGLRAVQAALLDMGFALHGGADGRYGQQTARALHDFQAHAARTFPAVRPTGTLDASTLRALDALAPAPGARGQSRALPSAFYDGQPVRVVVALREHRTFLFDPDGRLVDIFPNATGAAATPTRTGLKVVRAKLDQAATEAAGARLWNDRHVFGVRILDLSWANGGPSGEELHGTNAPALLGTDVSHGCIRHSNGAVLVLHDALSAGDRVAIVEHVDDPHLGVPVPVS